MLVGYVGEWAGELSPEREARGGESLRVGDATVWLCSTEHGSGIDRTRSAAIEGRLDLQRGGREPMPLSTEDLRNASGDFAVIAATPGGLLLGSGFAGGHRPLYVARFPDGRAIASTMLEPLVRAFNPRPQPDPEFAASQVLLQRPLSPTATPFVGIEQIPQGEAWLLTKGRVHREKLRGPQDDAELRGSHQDLARMLRDELEASLLRALKVAPGRSAIAVSGGLDSAMLIALACSLAKKGAVPERPAVYHWESESPFQDFRDEQYFRALAAHLAFQSSQISPSDAAVDFRRHLVVDMAPCAFPGLPFWTAIGRHARSTGIQTVVSGAGGDQVMEGQPWLFGELALRGHPFRAVRSAIELRGFEVGPLSRRLESVFRPVLGRRLPAAAQLARRRAAFRRRYPWAGARLRAHMEAQAQNSPPRPTLDWSPRQRYEALLSHRMFAADRHSALRAQEQSIGGHVRADPFLDDQFLRFVAALPPLALMHGGYLRGLLREAMRGLVPEEVRLRRTKAGLTPALVKTIELSGGFNIFRHLLDAPILADLGLVEPRPFRARFERLASDPLGEMWLDVWPFLAVEAFLRTCEGDEQASVLGTRT